MLNTQESVLIVIDVQGKLARAVAESEQVIRKIQQLVKGAKALEIPIILTNQVPEKLGDTIPEIADLLAGQHQVSRTSFSVFREVQVMSHWAAWVASRSSSAGWKPTSACFRVPWTS